MAYEEKRSWIMAIISLLAYAVYAATVGPRLVETSAASVPYVSALLWCVGGSILATMVLTVVATSFGRDGARRTDRRDREIYRLGQFIGQWCVVLGAVAALAMALARWEAFWIANVLYLGFTLSAVVASAARILAYRRGLPAW